MIRFPRGPFDNPGVRHASIPAATTQLPFSDLPAPYRTPRTCMTSSSPLSSAPAGRGSLALDVAPASAPTLALYLPGALIPAMISASVGTAIDSSSLLSYPAALVQVKKLVQVQHLTPAS